MVNKMTAPRITQAPDGGEFSTIVLEGFIETIWFDSDGNARDIRRTPINIADVIKAQTAEMLNSQ